MTGLNTESFKKETIGMQKLSVFCEGEIPQEVLTSVNSHDPSAIAEAFKRCLRANDLENCVRLWRRLSDISPPPLEERKRLFSILDNLLNQCMGMEVIVTYGARERISTFSSHLGGLPYKLLEGADSKASKFDLKNVVDHVKEIIKGFGKSVQCTVSKSKSNPDRITIKVKRGFEVFDSYGGRTALAGLIGSKFNASTDNYDNTGSAPYQYQGEWFTPMLVAIRVEETTSNGRSLYI